MHSLTPATPATFGSATGGTRYDPCPADPCALRAAELDAIADRLTIVGTEIRWMRDLPEQPRAYIALQLALVAARVRAVIATSESANDIGACACLPLDLEPFRLVATPGTSAGSVQ